MYEILLMYVLICGVVVFLLAILSVFSGLFVPDQGGGELSFSYECGFLPFDSNRVRFDVNFFVVGLLFLIFDLEVIFILPWSLVMFDISLLGVGGLGIFFGLLGMVFFYELAMGGLDF